MATVTILTSSFASQGRSERGSLDVARGYHPLEWRVQLAEAGVLSWFTVPNTNSRGEDAASKSGSVRRGGNR